MESLPKTIQVSDDGYSLPIADLMTGRGAAFGKSGSGKSNSVSVVAEELLSLGLPIVVVDIEGEYWGLTERFDVTYAGTRAEADVAPSMDVVDDLVESVLVDNEPLVLDVSGITDADEIDALLTAFVTRLFERELQAQKPCLLFVEEIHEFLPQSGGSGNLSEMLITVAKRGRKRGLGLCGISQRPAAVDKEFITQCEWIAWHRLTWENDTKVVEKILGRDAADRITTLDTGEALLMSDWDESLQRVTFRKKRTFDAGATPDLSAFSDDDLQSSERAAGETPSTAAASTTTTTTTETGDGTGRSTETRSSGGSTGSATSSASGSDASASSRSAPSGPPGDAYEFLDEAASFLLYLGGAIRRSLGGGVRRARSAVSERQDVAHGGRRESRTEGGPDDTGDYRYGTLLLVTLLGLLLCLAYVLGGF
ncbi:ATP-binding protein [Halomarina salina]|uniref:ATP-binding protein n=1 Tax=Halomarina salina TaxID=1872699 RepID=A0ABD5RP08_9EURY|nr:DUF87 domain-containing protein [Halomarina salina]